MRHQAVQVWQQMDSTKLELIRNTTFRQYQKAIDRFCVGYRGPLIAEAIQAHIAQVGVCLYTRILRTLFNNYYLPVRSSNLTLHAIKHRPPMPTMTYLSFIPDYIRNSKEFHLYEKRLESYINYSQPELRKRTNIRYQISLLWQLLQQHSNIEFATDSEMLVAIKDVCSTQRTGSKQTTLTKVAHIVRIMRKYSEIHTGTPPCLKYTYDFIKNNLHMNDQIIQNNNYTNNVKRRHPVGNVLSTGQINRMKSCTKSSRDEAIFMLMLETGLRRRAVSWMTLQSVTDGTNIRPIAYATEKGLKVRYFPLSTTLQKVLMSYITTHVPNNTDWLFPRKGDTSNHISSSTVRNIFVRICQKSCIPSHLSHCHAIRKFVVCELMRAGNSIEQVSKWLGHASVNTTYNHYWDISTNELSSQMKIPWLYHHDSQ